MFTDLGPGVRAALVGLGITNQALARFLVSRGVQVTGLDEKTEDQLGEAAQNLRGLGVELILGPSSFHTELVGFNFIFVTPGIRPDIPMVVQAAREGAIITNEIDLLLHLAPGAIIGITGSSGKTTTTSLVGHILRRAGLDVLVGGNIGEPLIEKLEEMTADTYLVLELSSFQLMTVRRSPQLAVITNITPNHLDYHTSMDEYIEAKTHIFTNQARENCVFLNADDPTLIQLSSKVPGKAAYFSRKQEVEVGACLDGGEIVLVNQGRKNPVLLASEVPLRGLHNLENVLAAIAVAEMCGVQPNLIAASVKDFRPVEHRLEFVREIGGIKYYNDSIATSPARAIAGLRSFTEPLLLIAGGYDKKLPFTEFVQEMPEKVKHLLLLGVTGPAIANLVDQLPAPVEYTMCSSLEEAVKRANVMADPGDVVLLSPACASFDMFPNYRERGRKFKEIVKGL